VVCTHLFREATGNKEVGLSRERSKSHPCRCILPYTKSASLYTGNCVSHVQSRRFHRLAVMACHHGTRPPIRSWCSCLNADIGPCLLCSSGHEITSAITTTLKSFRLGSALRTDMPPHVCNLSVRLSTSLHLNTSLQSTTYRPPTAKSRIRVDVNLNLTYRNIARLGFWINVTSTTPGGPRHLTTLTDASTIRNARDLYAAANRAVFVPCDLYS
jgi:hypothetical protein